MTVSVVVLIPTQIDTFTYAATDRAPAGSTTQKQKKMTDVTPEMVIQNRRIVDLST
jgi:hypothetical protein